MNNAGVLWIRVSSDEQAKGYSPDAQQRILETAASARNIHVVKRFKVAESARVAENRRYFKEMVEFVKKNEVPNLVALSEDRLGRNYQDLATLQTLVDKHNVSIVLAEDNRVINLDSGIQDRFLFQIMGSLAEMDNRIRGKKTRQGMEEKARKGGSPCYAPLGYVNAADPVDPTKRIIIIDPQRASLVKKALETYAAGGQSIITLTAEMNRWGLTSKEGTKITQHCVEKMLKNPFYYGVFQWSKTLYQGKHELLISKELFDNIQSRLELNRSYSRPAVKKYFPFRPFLRCGYCHTAITAEAQDGRHHRGEYVYYRCTGSKNPHCPLPNFRQEKIDEMISEALGELYVSPEIEEQIREQLAESHTEQKTFEKRQLSKLQADYTRRKHHLDILYEDRLNGILTGEQYKEKQTSIQAELSRIQSDIDRLGKTNLRYKEEGSTILELLKGFKQTYLKQDYQNKAKILACVLNRVILGPDGPVFLWKQPFQTLFDINAILKAEAQSVGKTRQRGE